MILNIWDTDNTDKTDFFRLISNGFRVLREFRVQRMA